MFSNGVNISPTITLGSIIILIIMTVGGLLTAWIKTRPASQLAENESEQIKVNEAELIRTDYAKQIRDFRAEVHGYRNDMTKLQAQLTQAQNTSTRRGDKLNMMRFILTMVIDELAARDPSNKVLAQARTLLTHIDDEPHQLDSSDTLSAAEDTADKAAETVRLVKAEEAREK